MKNSIHPMDNRWEQLAKAQYRNAYPELIQLFRNILQKGFLRCHWIPDPLALDYLTRILIYFLPVSSSKDVFEQAMDTREIDMNDPREVIRFYERIGELILWWSGIHRKPVYQAEGRRSFEIAYEQLSDFELPQHRFVVIPGQKEEVSSKRLKVNKMFSEQFENYQEILEKSDLIDDPAYMRYRQLFMTDDFSIN